MTMMPQRDRIRYAHSECSLGNAVVAGTDVGVCAIELADTVDAALASLKDRFPECEIVRDNEFMFDSTMAVVAFIDGERTDLAVTFDIEGTTFQHRVWDRLREIPAGGTLTYSALATELGDPDALRAVAGACAANPLAVIIPCHRVLRSDGGLGGYRWGVERKVALLRREGALQILL